MTGDTGLAQRLVRLLQEEHTQLEGFVNLLKQEESLLVASQIDPLMVLAGQKTEQYRRLQRLSDERIALFARVGVPVSKEAIQTVLGASPEALALWDGVIALAREAHERNRINGQLITERLQNNQQALSTLLMAAEAPQIYGPDGQSRPTASRRHLGSV